MRFPAYRPPNPVGPITLVGPGFRGLNTELTSVAADIDQQFALDLREMIFDDVGTISLRKGWTKLNASAITGTPDVRRVYEYLRADGTVSLVAASSGKFWASTDDGVTWSDVTGSTAPTGTSWKFVNFNDKIIAAAPGFKPIVYTGSGNFTAITASSGTVPTSNGELLAAYGRLWIAEDATGSIPFCGLLDETAWDEADGGGAIDPSNVWTLGTDDIISMRAFGATFVVCGRRHVIMYVDGAGSTIGIDPDNMYVVDTIENVGCIARDAIVQVGEGDIWMLGVNGVHSLKRSVADKTNPLASVTQWVESLMTSLIAGEGDARYDISAIWSAKERMALFLFDGADRIVMLDTRYPLADGTARVAEWRTQTHKCMATRRDGKILFGRTAGFVAYYNGYRDDTTAGSPTSYSGIYGSPWISGGLEGGNRVKLPKRVAWDIVGRETITVTTRWGYDFRGLEFSNTQTNDYVASGSEYALGEWNEAEWSGGVRTRRSFTPLCGNGGNFKIWFEITSTDVADRVSIKGLSTYVRIGRLR